jgi:uncharacterized protein
MSSQPAIGSGDPIQAALDAIMHHLDNIELKLERLQLLQMHIDALEAAVTDQDQHHQELRDAVHRVETAQSTLGGHRPPPRA